MVYKILADVILIIHSALVLFILLGFILTLSGFLSRGFFDKWLFRIVHLLGIASVSLSAIKGKYCPLTIWENSLRVKYDPASTYAGSCIVHYVKQLFNLEVNPSVLIRFTIFLALFTVVIFIIKPPMKITKILKKSFRA